MCYIPAEKLCRKIWSDEAHHHHHHHDHNSKIPWQCCWAFDLKPNASIHHLLICKPVFISDFRTNYRQKVVNNYKCCFFLFSKNKMIKKSNFVKWQSPVFLISVFLLFWKRNAFWRTNKLDILLERKPRWTRCNSKQSFGKGVKIRTQLHECMYVNSKHTNTVLVWLSQRE